MSRTIFFLLALFFCVPAVFAHDKDTVAVNVSSAHGMGAAKWKATSDEKIAKIEQQNAMIYSGAIVLAAACIGAGISSRGKKASGTP